MPNALGITVSFLLYIFGIYGYKILPQADIVRDILWILREVKHMV